MDLVFNQGLYKSEIEHPKSEINLTPLLLLWQNALLYH
jgi:hypothetical protein